MCGIVGYIGRRSAVEVLLPGLERVEYRGYDSAGVAVLAHGALHVRKRKGKVAALHAALVEEPLPAEASVGIAHTRWATHGVPSDVNAHPHVSYGATVALVHNGTIDNFSSLRAMLEGEGVRFRSQTDTEVLVHLIEWFMRQGSDLVTAVQKMHAIVEGAYAIAVLSSLEPGVLVAARNGGPLVLGIHDHGFTIGSDVVSVVEPNQEITQVVYLNDGEMIVANAYGYDVRTLTNERVEKQVEDLTLTLAEIAKGDFPHFMLKEIFEQPNALRRTLAGRVVEGSSAVHLGGMHTIEDFVRNRMTDIVILACGTSWHAGLVAEQVLEKLLRIPVRTRYASEFANGWTPVTSGTLVIVISQSGETKDTIAAAEKAKAEGATIWNVCNVVGSSLTRVAHSGVYLHAGPEIGVASTKAFSCQIVALVLSALRFAELRYTPWLPTEGRARILDALRAIPEQVEEILRDSQHVYDIARQYAGTRNALYLGREYNFPAALEGALKLKEISYIHAEGYPAGEMKHGPIALIDPDMPVVIIAPRHGENQATYAKVLANAEEVAARGGRVILIASQGDTRPDELRAEGKVERILRIPPAIPMLSPLLVSVYLQLLAYHIAVFRGQDVDQPRNLAKSVTVE